ncbi:MAG: hypothetical protein ACE5I4_08360, partial [Thermoplasmata archaeon]
MAESRTSEEGADPASPTRPFVDSDHIEGYPCTACGASLEFAPGTRSMECPYCGAQNQIEVDLTKVEEHDLEDLPLHAATT